MTKPYVQLKLCPSKFMTQSGLVVNCLNDPGKHTLHDGEIRGVRYSWHDKDTYVEPAREETVREKQVGGDHYKGALQPIDVVDAWSLDFYEGNALKYLARHRKKDGRKDIEKAIHYLQLLIERQYSDT